MDFDDFIDMISVMSDHVRILPFCTSIWIHSYYSLTGIHCNEIGLGIQDLWYQLLWVQFSYSAQCSSLDFNEDEFIDPEDLNHILDNLTGGTILQETKNLLIGYVRSMLWRGHHDFNPLLLSLGSGGSRCGWWWCSELSGVWENNDSQCRPWDHAVSGYGFKIKACPTVHLFFMQEF